MFSQFYRWSDREKADRSDNIICLNSSSKYNPIEHRLFPHVSRACQGAVFDSVETVRQLMAKTSTKTGLTVVTSIIDAVYETGRRATDDFIENMTILFDDYLLKWNDVARPQTT